MALGWQLKLMHVCDQRRATKTAVVLRAIFGWRFVDTYETFVDALQQPSNMLPAAGRQCVITPDGHVLTHWVDPKAETWDIIDLGHIHAFRDGFRRLADAAKLEDQERIDFFAEVRKWVMEDNRPEAVHNDLV